MAKIIDFAVTKLNAAILFNYIPSQVDDAQKLYDFCDKKTQSINSWFASKRSTARSLGFIDKNYLKQGRWEFYTDTNKLMMVIYFKNDQLHGEYLTFRDKCLCSHEYIENNLDQGEQLMYDYQI